MIMAVFETRDGGRLEELDAALRDHLDEVLDGLPDGVRDAMVLRYLAGLSEEAVARELGASPDAVRRRLGRGIASLRRRLDQLGHRSSTSLLESAIARLPLVSPSEGFADLTIDLCTGTAAMPNDLARTLQAVESALFEHGRPRLAKIARLAWSRFLSLVGA